MCDVTPGSTLPCARCVRTWRAIGARAPMSASSRVVLPPFLPFSPGISRYLFASVFLNLVFFSPSVSVHSRSSIASRVTLRSAVYWSVFTREWIISSSQFQFSSQTWSTPLIVPSFVFSRSIGDTRGCATKLLKDIVSSLVIGSMTTKYMCTLNNIEISQFLISQCHKGELLYRPYDVV